MILLWYRNSSRPGSKGLVFDYVPSLITSGIAGGLCFYKGFRGMDVLFALVQGDPVDIIVGIFLRHQGPGIAEGYGIRHPHLQNALSVWPNPVDGYAKISYSLMTPGTASLRIYGKNGCLVRMLKDELLATGAGTAYWDGKDEHGRSMPAGVYFVTLVTQSRCETSKVILLR